MLRMSAPNKPTDASSRLPRMLTVKEVAKTLRFSQAWVRDHITGRRSPALRAMQTGNRRSQWRVREEDLATFIESNLTDLEARRER